MHALKYIACLRLAILAVLSSSRVATEMRGKTEVHSVLHSVLGDLAERGGIKAPFEYTRLPCHSQLNKCTVTPQSRFLSLRPG